MYVSFHFLLKIDMRQSEVKQHFQLKLQGKFHESSHHHHLHHHHYQPSVLVIQWDVQGLVSGLKITAT